jgi:hypothetical protein
MYKRKSKISSEGRLLGWHSRLDLDSRLPDRFFPLQETIKHGSERVYDGLHAGRHCCSRCPRGESDAYLEFTRVVMMIQQDDRSVQRLKSSSTSFRQASEGRKSRRFLTK